MASVLALLLHTLSVGNGGSGLRSLATCLSLPKYRATSLLHPQVIRGTGVEGERWTDTAWSCKFCDGATTTSGSKCSWFGLSLSALCNE